jgi:hypothetical protein
MNIQTLVLFLIALFFASTITVDAHRNHYKPYTITKTSTNTITISKTCSTTPTPNQIHHEKKKHQKRHDNYRRNKKVVTITPTTTVCITPTPVCTPQNDGSFSCCVKVGNKINCNTELKEISLFIHN